MDEAAIVLDSNHRIIDYNNTGHRLLGQYDSDAIGSTIEDILPEISDWLSDTAPRMAFHQVTLTIENITRYYDVQILQLTRETNVVTGHILILRDVTERERHRQRLEVMNRILRHDLRNQMNILLAHVEELNSNPETVQEKTKLLLEKGKDIISLSDRARELEQTLVDRKSSTEQINLTELLNTQVAILKEDYPNATITVHADDSVLVSATPLLDSAFDNLLINAIEHNDSPNPEIHVHINNPSENADFAEIQISDNGPGLPDREQQVLERGRETPLDHSSGLGLWIVHWLITESGGSIQFDDNEPKGTIVTVKLPITKESTEQ